MEHGLLHATHSSCWCCCCCGPARREVELNNARLELSKNWPCLSVDGNASTVEVYQVFEVYEDGKMLTVHVLYVSSQYATTERHHG